MSKEPWNTLHLKNGDAKPVVDPDTVTIYAMRFDWWKQELLTKAQNFSRFCPYTERVILICLEKGLEFTVVNINLGSKPDWFLDLSPSGSIPVVQYKNYIVTGSVEGSLFVDQVCLEYYFLFSSLARAKASTGKMS